MATRIYKTPFAATGDKEALATADQPDGKVSLQAGWTPDYELPNDDANYRPVGRQEMNGILGEVTEGLGDIQLNGFASWQPIDGGWPIGAWVSHGGIVFRSAINNNSNEPGSDSSWVNPLSGQFLGIRVFTSTATYTPTPGTSRIVVEVQAGGGGGGGTEADLSANTIAVASGGGAGSYGTLVISEVPTSLVVTVGAGGSGGTGGFVNGVAGGSSSFGSLLTCAGGLGGAPGRSAQNTVAGPTSSGGAGGATPSGATYSYAGAAGNAGLYINAGVLTGAGGSSRFGGGGAMLGSSTAGFLQSSPGTGYGAGGSGSGRVGAGAVGSGGSGSPGIVVIKEYS